MRHRYEHVLRLLNNGKAERVACFDDNLHTFSGCTWRPWNDESVVSLEHTPEAAAVGEQP